LLQFTEKGIYCPLADVYIDPWVPVERAIITHAHSDHAKPGCNYYLAHTLCAPVLRLRLGADIILQELPYGETLFMNGVKISLHPAGHIIGSAQVRIEHSGEVWVVSGDYKIHNDGVSEAFESVKCDTFITECTFGLPVFKWRPQQEVFHEINQWWQQNKEEGKTSVLFGYPLGKSQRLLFNIDRNIGNVFAHGAIYNTNEVLRLAGAPLPEIRKVNPETNQQYNGALILAPPSALQSPWMKKFKPFSTGIASGWMNLRGAKRRNPVDRGFVISDHADWEGLIEAVKSTGASRIFATHGYKSAFSRYLSDLGYEASEVETLWEGEVMEATESERVSLKDGEEDISSKVVDPAAEI
jgi:putative mRNA 3-end processing factor